MALGIIDSDISSDVVTEILPDTDNFKFWIRIRKDEQHGTAVPGFMYNIDRDSSSTNTNSFYLKKLTTKGNFFLKHEVELIKEVEDDGYILSNNTLNVHAFGETFAQAIEEWEFILINIYMSYINTPDNELTTGGKNLKERLQDYVGVINAH